MDFEVHYFEEREGHLELLVDHLGFSLDWVRVVVDVNALVVVKQQ